VLAKTSSKLLLWSTRPDQDKHVSGLGKNKNMVIGPKTKNDCAGKNQQQITAQERRVTMVRLIQTYS
jgi:hypothetical protein